MGTERSPDEIGTDDRQGEESGALAPARRGISAFTVAIVGFLLVVGLLVYPLRAQESSRMALTASLYERGSVVIDGYPVGIDRAIRDGVTYSDKGPGHPVLAIPFYAIAVGLGLPGAANPPPDGNLTLWVVTLATSTLPAVGLFFVMRALARGVSPRRAEYAAAALATGTVLLPFSTILFGHVLSALLIAAAFILVGKRPRHLFWSGLLAGIAVTVEYTAAIALVGLVVWVAVEHRSRLLAFLMGGAGPAVGLASYNAAAFGSPWTLSYQFSAFSGVRETAAPVTSAFRNGSLDNVVMFLFSGRGLLIATPIVLAGVAGTILQGRRSVCRRPALVALGVFAAFCLIPILWSNPWGGDSPGARYIAPSLPLLAPGLAYLWERRPVLSTGLWVISGVTMLTATLTDALVLARTDPRGLTAWGRAALEGDWMPNLLGALWGSGGDQVFFVLVALSLLGIAVAGVRGRGRSSPLNDSSESPFGPS